uniref:Uncharacterized protein n=1 Tax=Arundo donax TaxID=35708 RepID=A0A0A8ZC85_ARUDO
MPTLDELQQAAARCLAGRLASRPSCRSTCAGRRGTCTRPRGSPPSCRRARSCSCSRSRPRTCGSATRSTAPPPPALPPSLRRRGGAGQRGRTQPCGGRSTPF